MALFLFFFFAYMLGASRAVPWSDGKMIHQVAESIVARGSVDIEVRHKLGADGRPYALHPLLPSLIHVPGAWLEEKLRERTADPDAIRLGKAFTSHLGPSFVGALGCLLLFRLACFLGLGRGAAAVATGVYGFGTIAWLYARYPYSEIVQLTAFTGFFGAVLRATRGPSVGRGLAAGLWAGALLNSKLVYALSLPGALAFVLFRHRREGRRLVGLVLAAAVGMAPWIAMILLYNHARWGTYLAAGYDVDKIPFTESLWVGLYGLLLSPARGLFVYSPPLIITILALVRFRAGGGERRDLLFLLLLLAGPVVFTTARLPFWSGDLAWGPRYLVFVTGAMFLPACVWLRDALARRKRARLAAAGALAAVGIGVQVVANAFYWDTSWRMASAVRTSWLGSPNRSGTAFFNFQGTCEPCFEDLYHLLWLPPFQPIVMNAWLLPHVWEGDSARAAQANAPWKRYTSLEFDITDAYARAVLDWWYWDFEPRFVHEGRRIRSSLMFGMAGAALAFGVAVRRARRRESSS